MTRMLFHGNYQSFELNGRYRIDFTFTFAQMRVDAIICMFHMHNYCILHVLHAKLLH